jgi:HSP20 family protein
MSTATAERPVTGQATTERYLTPAVNISETPEAYVLEAEMPGVAKDGLEITVEGGQIVITGRRATESVAGEVLLRERHELAYRRAFELDPAVDTTKVSAKLDQGLVTVTLPKSERVKPRRITVE